MHGSTGRGALPRAAPGAAPLLKLQEFPARKLADTLDPAEGEAFRAISRLTGRSAALMSEAAGACREQLWTKPAAGQNKPDGERR
jgi:hypothetical protein